MATPPPRQAIVQSRGHLAFFLCVESFRLGRAFAAFFFVAFFFVAFFCEGLAALGWPTSSFASSSAVVMDAPRFRASSARTLGPVSSRITEWCTKRSIAAAVVIGSLNTDFRGPDLRHGEITLTVVT